MTKVRYEVNGAVGLITIDRPEALNALNSAVLKELDQVLDQVDLEQIRCLVITGAGEKSFIAGADVAEMSDMNEEQGKTFGKTGNDLFRKIESFPVPVIAAINGFALGGVMDSHELRYPHLLRKQGFRTANRPGHHPGFGGTHTWHA